MIRRHAFAAAFTLLFVGLLCLFQAQAQMGPLLGVQGKWTQTSRSAAYQGPGDIAPGAKAFLATSSCYTLAYSGNVALIVDNATGAVTTTLGCSAGVVSVTSGSALSITCASTCNYERLYDQSGALACTGGTACDVENLTRSAMVTRTANSINTSACSSLANGLFLTSANWTLAQPLTVNTVSKRIGLTSNYTAYIGDTSSAPGLLRFGYANAANATGMYNGASIANGPTASDGVFHSLGYVWANATQSKIYVDGTGTNYSLGAATAWGGSSGIAWGRLQAGDTGQICETGIWDSDLGATVMANLSTNARTRYGSF